jgi:hypothetical protein
METIMTHTGLVKVKQCGLCGLEFEEHNLPGVVSFQAIANLRKRYNAATLNGRKKPLFTY